MKALTEIGHKGYVGHEFIPTRNPLAGLTQADSSLGLFFSNRDFGSQVLGELKPQSRLVVARQKFAEGTPVPTLKLPAFAAVFELKNPQEFSPVLLAAYQTAIGVTNVDGVQKGRPQLLQKTSDYRGATLYEAAYLLPPGMELENAEIIYNFRPSCAVHGNHFILASTAELARALIDELGKPAAEQSTAANTHVAIDLAELATVLADNQQAIITQNMLEKGHSRDEAAAEVQWLLRLLEKMRGAELQLTPGEQTLDLMLSVGLQTSEK
mgnify:CR=1 FL=1